MEENVRYPRFISSGPCGKDLFAGQAHQRIAEEIAQQLLHPSVPHVIGLDGGWGAGKSNIIEIVRRKAQEKKKVGDVLFFTYNAWGHQGDPLRRSILEELTRCIVHSNTALADEKERENWDEKLKTLTSQRKEVSTKTFPKLSAGIIVFLLVIPLTPVFNAIAKALPAFLNQWTEGIVTATPILLALIYTVIKIRCKLFKWLRMLFNRKMRCKFRRKKMNSRKEKKRSSFESFLSELFYLYKGGVQETETHEEVYSSEATSTQFKDWIDKLDKALKARLVIVIDDMDRLPARSVQELWAAIHTLFTEVKYERIKVIVPFDRSHLISAFREENIQGKDSTPKCYGNDFIDKTFDAVYRVPPPILSDWKDYLSTQWKTAFGEEPRGSITQIYDLLADGKTPREIIAFINECVTIKRTCTSEIPDEYIALFAVGKHEIVQDPQRELLELKFCQPLSYRYDNEETRKYLSAIHYQLDPQKALDAIYVDQLRRELDKGESTLLQTLVSKSIFTSILECAIAGITHVENATMALTKVKNGNIDSNFWNQLLQKAIEKVHGLEMHAVDDYQITLLQHSSARIAKVANKFIELIVQETYKESTHETLDIDKMDPLKDGTCFDASLFCFKMESARKSLKGKEHLADPVNFTERRIVSAESYIGFVQTAKQSYAMYKIECFTQSIISRICSMSVGEMEELSAFPYIVDVLEGNVEEIASSLLEKIRNVDTLRNADTLLKRWCELKAKVERYMLPENKIVALLDELETRNRLKYELYKLRHRLLCMIIAQGGAQKEEWVNELLENRDKEFDCALLAKLINRFIDFDDLLLMHNKNRIPNLHKRLARSLIGCIIYERVLNFEKVFPHYAEILDAYNLQLEELLKDWSLFQFENSITPKTALYIPAQFFIDTRELGQNELVQHCRETAIQYLDTLSKEEWEIAVREKNHAYELFTALQCDPPENGKEILV